MSMLKIVPIEWDKEVSRTKQAFKDQCDVNKMLKKAQTTGSMSHLLKYPEPIYGEFDGEFNLLEASKRIKRSEAIFNDLPSEVRREFNHNAIDFVRFAADPKNNSRLAELLPAIAAPGSYFPNPVKRGGGGAGAATPPAGARVVAETPRPEPSASGSTEATQKD